MERISIKIAIDKDRQNDIKDIKREKDTEKDQKRARQIEILRERLCFAKRVSTIEKQSPL